MPLERRLQLIEMESYCQSFKLSSSQMSSVPALQLQGTEPATLRKSQYIDGQHDIGMLC